MNVYYSKDLHKERMAKLRSELWAIVKKMRVERKEYRLHTQIAKAEQRLERFNEGRRVFIDVMYLPSYSVEIPVRIGA